MSPSLVAEHEGARQPCFTKSAEEPTSVTSVCRWKSRSETTKGRVALAREGHPGGWRFSFRRA